MDCMREQFKEGVVLDGRYEVKSPINSGSYGMVILANDLQTGERVAVKCLLKPSDIDYPSVLTDGDHIWELQCYKHLGRHPGIVEMYRSFETKTHLFLVLEFCPNGDLFEVILSNRGPSETERVRSLMLQLVDSVEHMHSKGLYHRDIKPENIFLTQNGDMKLGDFGLATEEKWSHDAGIGTERYMAPEQYDPGMMGYSTAKADIWAVGITLIGVIFGRNLFELPAESDVHFADYVRNSESLFDKYPTMTSGTFEVLTHALSLDPEKRSLEAFRTALTHVESFTTDDEELDFFCIGDREIVPVKANRQPLPTPSIKKDEVDQEFWTNLLHTVAQRPPITNLPVPELEACEEPALDPNCSSLATVSHVAVTPSVGVVGDSSLGASLESIDLRKPDDAPTSIKVEPVAVTRPKHLIPSLSEVFGKKGNSVSKSWYDLCDEDDEEAAAAGKSLTSFELDARAEIALEHGEEEVRSASVPIAAVERELSPQKSSAIPSLQPIHARPSVFGLDGADDPESDYIVGQQTRTFMSKTRYSPPFTHFGFDGMYGREKKFSAEHPIRPFKYKSRYSPPFGFDGIDERDNPHRLSITKGRTISPRQDIMDKWAELGKRRRAFDGGSKGAVFVGTHDTGVNAVKVGGDIGHDEGGDGRKGVQNQKAQFYDGTSTDDLEWVGGWHHIE